MRIDMDRASLLHLENATGQRYFVGRYDELGAFVRALDQPGPHVFYVHGPAGVGKTSLLQAFVARAVTRAVRCSAIDLRDLTIHPGEIVAALDRHQGPTSPEERRLLCLDTYELVRPIDAMMAREVLRRADERTTIVLAGRSPPSVAWRSLALWGTRVVPISLRNLNEEDAVRCLERRGVPAASCVPIARFAHGHPLALALAADAWRNSPHKLFTPEDAPDVVRELYAYLMSGVPDGTPRRALEAAAVLHTTTEALLTPLVGDTSSDWFGWLCALNFMMLGQRGIFPHDLAREVILAELRWRCPERLMQLTARAQRLLAARVEAAAPAEFTLAFSDFAFALSHNPRATTLRFTVDELWLDDLRPADEPTLQAAVARHEGPEAHLHLCMWIAAQPEAFKVARDVDGAVVAFIANIRLDHATADQLDRDPIAAAAASHAVALLGEPLRRPVGYGRWFMGCEDHQEPSLGMAVCSQSIGPLFLSPGFAYYYVRFDRWERWADAARLCRAVPVPELAHAIADRRFTVTLQDHLGLTGVEWMLRFGEDAELHEWTAGSKPAPDVSPLAALSRDEFAARVREALRCLTDPLVLAKNPLIHCRTVRERCGGATAEQRVDELTRLLRREIAALRGSQRGDRWYRALHSAYVEPLGKHESIAPLLGQSYSTFRRLLAAGTQHIVDSLWTQETA